MRRNLMIALTASTMWGGAMAQPLAANESCLEEVLTLCADAMDGAAWWEKIAIGAWCSGLAGLCIVSEAADSIF